MTRPLLIFGAGGFAREVLQIARDLAEAAPLDDAPWAPAGFLIDAGIESPASLHGLQVYAVEEGLRQHPDAWCVIALGNSAARSRVAHALQPQIASRWATLVHPMAWVGRHVDIGPGSIVCAGSQVTTDIRIGLHVHVNIGCTIGHDSVLHDFVTLSPGVNVSGNVCLGRGVEVGTGSALIPHAGVDEWSIIGAGSVVTKTVVANVTAVGAPAKIIKTRPVGWHLDGLAS